MKKKDIIRLVEMLIYKDKLEEEMISLDNYVNNNEKEYELSLVIVSKGKKGTTYTYAKKFIGEYESNVTQLEECKKQIKSVNEIIEGMED